MKKRRAVSYKGPSIINLKYGPERNPNIPGELEKLKDDCKRLEATYPSYQCTIINEGDPLYKGKTDPIFNE